MRSGSTSVDRWLSKPFQLNWETWVYIAILLLALFTRFYMLGERTMSHDESLHTKFSWDLYKNGVFQHTPLMHGPILFHMTALDYFLFGDNDFTARIYPAVLGVLMVMFPLLFRRWLGRWGAILASIMFLVSPLILYYNRYIREDTPSIFYTLVMVYCTFMYINGPRHLRRKARWLYIFAAAMLASLATKEVAFMYIAIFTAILALYFVVRLGQRYLRLPGKSLFYFLSVSILLGGVAALVMYIIADIIPLNSTLNLPTDSVEYSTLVKWVIALVVSILIIVVGTLLWAFRRSDNRARLPWLDVLSMLAIVVVVASFMLIVEERSRLKPPDAATASAPAVPGQETTEVATSGYKTLPLYAEWAGALVIVGLLIASQRAGWWVKLRRFAEFDLIIIMVTLVLPWSTPFVMKALNPSSLTSMPEIARAVQAAIPIQFDLSSNASQIFLSALPVLPAFIVAFTVGLIWNPKRWLIAAAIFHAIFLFFFTTVFTNLSGIGTGMIGSLGYWLEQQAVRRGSQPQYYYLVLILPFYEFLPVIGSILAMLAGMTMFWRFRRDRLVEPDEFPPVLDVVSTPDSAEVTADEQSVATLDELITHEKPKRSMWSVSKQPDPAERLLQLSFPIFAAWWAVFNMIAYTLAGEKMPWLGTHMTTPMIFLAGWYFGRYVERIDFASFKKENWQYLLLLPVLFVALAQPISALLIGNPGGLEQTQLAQTFQWIGGVVIAAAIIYFISRLVMRSGFTQLRVMIAVTVFFSLTFLTFRSAWMASFINYDFATEYLVYAHGGPANKQVTEQLEDLSKRITGGMDLKFSYDFKISWPGAWYFRNFTAATFLGENPSPKAMEDSMVVIIVGDENRANVESALEDRYYRFDYPRMWWPMQDYFGLTAQRVIDTFSFTDPKAAQVRQGIWDIWWSRDYKPYGDVLQRDFSLTKWPVADKMYVFVRKDIAAQVWDLGTGDGTAITASTAAEPNLCTTNWQPLTANLVFQSVAPGLPALNHPRQIALAPDGRLFLSEEFNHRISAFNPDGTFDSTFGQLGQLYQEGDAFFGKANTAEGGLALNRPNGIAIGASGNIYVADTWNYRVVVYTSDGRYLNSWGQRGEFGASAPTQPTDGFWGPRGIAVDAEENVYVADTGNKRIRVYSSNGTWLRDIGSTGSGVGQLDEPSSVVVGADFLLYAADYWNRRISVFTLDGVPLTNFVNNQGQSINSFRVRGWLDDQGNRPYLALDNPRNLLYITDPDAGRVLVYNTKDGNCVGAFGQPARENTALDLSQLNSVGGVAVDADGNVYVADAGAGRVLRFAPFPLPDQSVSANGGSGEVVPPVIVPESTDEVAG
ncbi:MAG: TIGR03663 family protein [Anaerolineae bacterium]